jgi:phosphoribosylcarboxyaminoimidazole (NCAIR) mutase
MMVHAVVCSASIVCRVNGIVVTVVRTGAGTASTLAIVVASIALTLVAIVPVLIAVVCFATYLTIVPIPSGETKYGVFSP